MEKRIMEISKSWRLELWQHETERGHLEKEDLLGQCSGSYKLRVRLARRGQQE